MHFWNQVMALVRKLGRGAPVKVPPRAFLPLLCLRLRRVSWQGYSGILHVFIQVCSRDLRVFAHLAYSAFVAFKRRLFFTLAKFVGPRYAHECTHRFAYLLAAHPVI